MALPDFLEDIEKEETKKNPNFPQLVKKALSKNKELRIKVVLQIDKTLNSENFRKDIATKVSNSTKEVIIEDQLNDVVDGIINSICKELGKKYGND